MNKKSQVVHTHRLSVTLHSTDHTESDDPIDITRIHSDIETLGIHTNVNKEGDKRKRGCI